MGGASPLATWIGASLALHLVAAALWWAAPAPPAPVAQARHLALEILDGGETQAQRAEHQQSGITEVRPAGDLPAATSSPPPPVHRGAIRQPVPLEPPARRAEARPARDTATPPPVDRTSARAADTREATPSVALATAPQPAPDTHITQRLQDQLLERLAEQLRYPPLARARRHLDSVAPDVTLITTGGLRTPADFAKALALGADGVAVSNAALQAIGCLGMRACNTNNCPVGIATQKKHLRDRLPVDEAADRLARYFGASVELMQVLARACGHRNLKDFRLDDLTTFKREVADLTGVAYAGVGR